MPQYQLPGNPTQAESQSSLSRLLILLDFFRYIPIPSLTPVSTKPSKVASLIFILFALGYVIYGLVMFITNNVPKTNSYVSSNLNSGYSYMPFLSFGVYYIDPLTGDTTVINDPSILSLSFIGQIVSGRSLVYKLPLPIKQCNNDSSISPFCFDFQTYQNLIKDQIIDPPVQFASLNDQLILSINKTTGSVITNSFNLQINLCTDEPYCLSQQQIFAMLKSCTLQIIIKQPSGYDYVKGQPIIPPQPAGTLFYQYLLSNQSILIGQYYYQPTQFRVSPNLLTTFKKSVFRYTRMTQEVTAIEPYMGSSYTIADIRFTTTYTLNQIQITPATILQKISEWSAFLGFTLMLGALVFLTYNRTLFHKQNPQWRKFDKMLQKRLSKKQYQLELIKRNSQSSRNETVRLDQTDRNGQLKQKQFSHISQDRQLNQTLNQNMEEISQQNKQL